MLHIDEIPYQADSAALFEVLRELPDAAFLDSCHGAASAGRYDIMVAMPATDSPQALSGDTDQAGAESYFAELAYYHRSRYHDVQSADGEWPFCGGLLGYLGYELGSRLHGIDVPGQANTPLANVKAYDWCVIQDHLLARSALVALPALDASLRADLLRRLRDKAIVSQSAPFRLSGAFDTAFDADTYAEAFGAIADYLLAGDCYQVNLARHFTAPYEGDPFTAYKLLRSIAGAPFSAYLTQAEGAVLCVSPERFLSLKSRRVETRPIKGTRPRALDDPERDWQLATELRNSRKDRAENLMIVDLLRNDLGRNCEPGSIRVDNLFSVESYPTVHHLVSTISGELLADRSAVDLLRDSFPGGSITGAPKRRAMEIIAELEPQPRQAYCGSALYISADGRMDSNITIRTLVAREGQLHCWGGGGIVADSNCEEEFQETLDKVGRFLHALEAHSGLR